jgi:hypothetical protein
MLKKILNHIKKDFPIYFGLVILLSLLFKNPFSLRTQIPNFAPFPDSFHYLSPARCFVNGDGFDMCLKNNEGTNQSVPPVYSILMIPFFIISSDPRNIYFLNVLLSIISLVILYKIFQKLTKNKLIISLSLFIYTTTYLTYWFPALVMAENVLLPLFLAAIYLLTLKPNNKRVIVAGLIAAGMYGTKYAALGLFAGYSAIYSLYLINNRKKDKKTWSKLFLFISIALIFYFLFGGWGTVKGLIRFIQPIAFQTGIAKSVAPSAQTDSWYASPKYMIDNLSFYFNSFILGTPLRILWDTRVLLPIIISLSSVIGLIMGVINKKTRWMSTSLIALSVAQIVPILPFYAADGRYAITLFPTLIIGFTIFLKLIDEKLKKIKKSPYIFHALIVVIALFFSLLRFKDLKLQLVLNLKYAETPWWYVATQTMNDCFLSNSFEKKPYLITLTSPFYLDYFGNGKYYSLPLSESQDFRKGASDRVWGISKEKPLIETYSSLLEEGNPVYITNYGINATEGFKNEFKLIEETFELTKVNEGCYDLCNIYELKLKKNTDI